MLARWWTFGVWALVAGSALFWSLRLVVKAQAAPQGAVVAQASSGTRGDLTRLFGVDAPPPAAVVAPTPVADARFQLIGVVTPRGAGAGLEGVALIAVDGKPAKAYRVGATVTGTTVLQAVRQRGATLGQRDGGGQMALELAPLPAPATGNLPNIGGDADGNDARTANGPRRPGAPGSVPQPGDNANEDVMPATGMPQQNESPQTR
jgi:general secretion pathway protein C